MSLASKIIEKVAANPATILIFLGLLVIFLAIVLPLTIGFQMVFGVLGVLTLIVGLIVHTIFVQC